MKKVNWFVCAILIISAVLFTLGVFKKIAIMKNKKSGGGKTIAVIPKGTVNIWWEVVRKGAADAAAKRGFKVHWAGPKLETDREAQIQTVEDAISKGVSAVVLAPNDAKALVRPIEKVHDAKLPCVLIDSLADTEKYDSFAATDGYAGGAQAAEILGKALNGHGKALVVLYVQSSESCDARYKGFADTMAKSYPGIVIQASQYTMGTIEDARKKTEDLLRRFPETDCVYAVNQASSIGAFKAIQSDQQAGKIHFVGFDSDPVLLEGIESGIVDSLIVQNPWLIGYTGVMMAADLLEGKKVQRHNSIPSMIVNAENLEQMKKENPEALGL